MDSKKKSNKKKHNKKKSGKNTASPIPISVTSPLQSPQNAPPMNDSYNSKNKKGKKKSSKKYKSSNNLILDTPTISSTENSSPSSSHTECEYKIKEHVLLSKDREGIIKFIGQVHFTKGILYGIELLNGSIGKHDGMIDDRRYFQTPSERGIFVRKKQIRRKMRNKDYTSSLRLRRAASIENINTGSSIIKMISSNDIKMVHANGNNSNNSNDIHIINENNTFKTANTMVADPNSPKTQRGKEKKVSQLQQRRNKKQQRIQHQQEERRSSSAKRNGSSSSSSSSNNLITMDIDDTQIFNKILKANTNTNNVSDDNSDWDDNDNDNESDNNSDSSEDMPRKRVQTMHETSGSSHVNHHRMEKFKRKRQSVDDMIIDNYFGGHNNNHHNMKQKEREHSFHSVNRVHSRIPDYRHQNKKYNSTIPASFKRFQESKTNNKSIVSDKNNQKLQKRRSREHLLHSHRKNSNNRHNKHSSVHIMSKTNSTNNIYDDDDLKFDEYNMNAIIKPKKRRSSLVEHNYKHKHKHNKGAQSAMDLNAINLQSMKSVPVGFNGNANNKNHSHSRFQSVTNAISKGWNFAKKSKSDKKYNYNKKKKSKSNSKSKKNAIFAIDPETLDSTLILTADYDRPIPNVLIKLREELFQNDGHLIEGIFRVAPNATDCKQIENELNDGKFLTINFSILNCALIANLIKIFFRQLPNQILQNIDSSKIEFIQNTQNISDVGDIVDNDMNEPNKSYFKWLLDLCVDIIKHEKINKMSCKNMAVVISPNLFDPTKIQNPMKAMTLSAATADFLNTAIQWRHANR